MTHRSVAILGVLFAASSPALADVVYLKNGMALHGKVRREADMVVDPLTGSMIPIIKGNNFFIVDDKARWTIFPHQYATDADPDVNIRGDFLDFLNPISQDKPLPMPGAAQITKISPFKADGTRIVNLMSENGKYAITQKVTQFNAYAAKVESKTYRWNTFYLTPEIGFDDVKRILDGHPELIESGGPDIERRMKKFRFYLQANHYQQAGKELDDALAVLPMEKERIDRTRRLLKATAERALWDETKQAHEAGRFIGVGDVLRKFSAASDIDARLAADVAALKAKYDVWERKSQTVRGLFDRLRGRLGGPLREDFADAIATIQADLDPDLLDRLDPFATFGAQFEMDLANGKNPQRSIEEVLSLAVSGWVLGGLAAEPKLEVAQRYWRSRRFVADYLRNHDAGARRRNLDAYEKSSPLSIDELTQIIAMLPPPEPADIAAAKPGVVENRTTQVPWSQNKPVNYSLMLPPEYRPTRSYPVLIALHGAGETPSTTMAHWTEQAMRRGYIVAAPQWGSGGIYAYTPDEHNCVLEVVRDLRRRYSVDSDRVFLTGYGEGGTMAFDVGLSHPDQFAGVLPVNGRPNWNASYWYWKNAIHLPFYIVAGEVAGNTCTLNRRLFENWVSKGYPSLMTIYKGRPMEFYALEPKFAFEWMDRTRRATGFPELGRNPNLGASSEDLHTMRPTDNRFYWLGVESINDKYVNSSIPSKSGSPAALQAIIKADNQIVITSRGIKTLRVWLGRTWDAQAGAKTMIDFAKPVSITVNRQAWGGPKGKVVTPSLATMLEDLYTRGDRQRYFMAYVDLTNLQ